MKPNRLINQTSPYLLQHSHNPVDWFPWGEEAFKKAIEEDKPIFLSIGYSTCHWCHVMEKESFEDMATAEIMNRVFVCIKVDREEHPDIDEMFMTACNMIAGNGGWPLSVFLTPDLVPFFAATYIPRESYFGRTGLKDLAGRIHRLWTSSKDAINESAFSVKEGLESIYKVTKSGPVSGSDFSMADDKLKSRFDAEYGGFLPQPKFPMPHALIYLMKRFRNAGDKTLLGMALHTLRKMRSGGIWDHVGLGFHRYSTDREWFLPHFEKMLYDQALCASAYLEAYSITGDDFYRTTASEIFEYVLSDLLSPEGGFYSAEDADSEGEEGRFYTWEYKELESFLEMADLDFLKEYFGVTSDGNFNDEASGKNTGRNLFAIRKDGEGDFKYASETFNVFRNSFLEKRKKRIRPLLDTKIIASWNGLMIMALSLGYKHTGERLYLESAIKAADFIRRNMISEDGRLLRCYTAGKASIPAVSQDYAHLITGLIYLYEVSGREDYLEWSKELQDIMISDFFDKKDEIFRMSPEKGKLCVNPFDIHDSAIPSTNSSAIFNLIRLSSITGRRDWKETADKIIASVSGSARKWPDGFTWFFHALCDDYV